MDTTTPSQCLIVAHNYHPAVGAAATRLQLLTERLLADGWQVTVLTSAADRRLRGPNGEDVVGTSRSWMPGSRLFRTAILAGRVALAAGRYDVVVSDPPPYVALASMLGARLRRRRAVFYYCDSWASVATSRSSSAWRLAGRLFQGIEDAAARLADVTIASTPALAQRAGQLGGDVEMVRNGTDLAVYEPQGERWRHPNLPERYFVYAGTMGLVHGADVFARAAAELWAEAGQEGEQFGVVFVGAGTEAEQIREAAAAAPGRMLFLDPVTPAEVAPFYRGCVGALSSMRPVPGYEDAWPVKTLAAMACGAIPVYVSGGELATELQAEQLGFVEPYGVEGAKRAMRAALALSNQERSAMAERCRDHALNHFDQRRAAATVAGAIAHSPLRDLPV